MIHKLTLVLSLFAQHQQLTPPVAKESGMPFLVSAPNGNIYLSYIDYLGADGHALRFTTFDGKQWSRPETIAEGKNWFINWADFPSLAIEPDGNLLAHWLTRSTVGGKYGYGIRIARRNAATRQWTEIHGISLEEPKDYAGFLTFLPNASAAIYLAPPESGPDDSHRKTVRFVELKGKPTEVEIDPDACSCCQTAVAMTPKGLVAAYRDHRQGEIRDISISRLAEGKWSKPEILHQDRWKINGCPTDGPAIATHQNNTAISWLTRANDQPKVQVALSRNSAQTFNKPIRVDDGNPLGRATITNLDSNHFLIIWIEKTGTNGEAEIRIKRLSVDGRLSEALVIARTNTARTTGFPKIAVSGKQILTAWRDGNIRTAISYVTQFDTKDTK
ncbi:MAG: exo-alpha-sialidase [Acidobacteria bacterium]|nr:exo-alpha-sialidase [Acidobacteriota bacterium]